MEVARSGLAIALIVVLSLDAIACAIPIPYIKDDLDRLKCSPQIQRAIPLVKFVAIAGLIIGLWQPWLGALACIGMLIYFGFAFWYHAEANDSLDKYLPAIAFATFIGAVLYLSYLPAA